jgi:hypothetical protein
MVEILVWDLIEVIIGDQEEYSAIAMELIRFQLQLHLLEQMLWLQ